MKIMAANITIGEIAEALGVSKSTVSRAISGKGRISPETVERVQSYVQEHGYCPRVPVHELAQKKTFNIGVVCPIDFDIFNLPFFHKCLRGISEETSLCEYDILLAMVDGVDFHNLKRCIENHKVDGVILTRTIYEDPIVDYLLKEKVPFVTIGRSPIPEVVQVDIDHIDACRELTSILLAKGSRKLALIGRDEKLIITESRYQGFLAAYRQAGVPQEEAMIYMDTINEQKISYIVGDALSRGVQGLVCMDEKIAMMVMAELHQREVKVPQDIKVASFYNDADLENTVPPVTAIDIDDEKLGSLAVATLMSMINGEDTESRFLKSFQVMMRESTSDTVSDWKGYQ